MENGAPTDRINDIIQCSDGFIWMATYEGLVRFDGSNSRVFNHQDHPALMGGLITITESAPGELWMLNNSNNLVRIRGGEYTVWTTRDGLPARGAELLIALPGGSVLLLGQEGFLTIDADDRVVPFATPGLQFRGTGRYAFGPEGTLWYAPGSGGLIAWQDGWVREFDLIGLGLAPGTVLNLQPMPDGSVWLATEGGAAHLQPDDSILRFFANTGFQFQARLLRFAKNSGSRLIGGHSLGNLQVFSPHGLERLPLGRYEDVFEAVDSITALANGGYAIGTYSRGLILLSPSLFPFYNRQNGLDGHLVNSLTPQADGTVVVATHSGAFVYQEGMFTRLTRNGEVVDQYLVDAFTDSKGRLWLATRTLGVLMRDTNGDWVQIDRSKGLSHRIARTFAEDLEGNIWIGTRSGLHRWNEGLKEYYGLEQGLRSDYVLNLHVTPRGDLLIGTVRGGLHRLRNGRIEPLTGSYEGQLPDTQTIFNMTTHRDGTVWGGSNDGLFKIKDDEPTFFALWQKAPIGPIYHVLDDGVGHIWLTSASGLYRFERDLFIDQVARSQRLTVVPRVFGRRNGLPTDAMRPVSRPMRSADNKLWLATENGFIIVDPSNVSLSGEKIPVYFDGVEINGKPLLSSWHQANVEFSVQPNLRRIQFRFTAPMFTANDVIEYRVRMLGFDTEWRTTSLNTVEYTNLPPGNFAFEVQAANSDGVWSNISTVAAFTVAPMLVQRVWFYPLVAMLIVALIVAAYNRRIRFNRVRQKELENMVAKRTADLRQSEQELLAKNARLLELDKDKSNLLSIAAHDLRNPVGNIQSLAALMETDIMQTGNPELIEFNRDIQNCSQRILDLISNILDQHRIEQGECRADLQPCDVFLAFRDVVAANQSFSNRKQIQLVIQSSGENLPLVVADPQMLVQVLDNLVSNALKFSEPGTEVRLTAKVQGGNRLRLTVADQGPGLTAQDRSRLFVKFAKLSTRPTGGESSTGLGLSISQQLVVLMNGVLLCESEPGLGTSFHVDLPMVTTPHS